MKRCTQTDQVHLREEAIEMRTPAGSLLPGFCIHAAEDRNAAPFWPKEEGSR